MSNSTSSSQIGEDIFWENWPSDSVHPPSPTNNIMYMTSKNFLNVNINGFEIMYNNIYVQTYNYAHNKTLQFTLIWCVLLWWKLYAHNKVYKEVCNECHLMTKFSQHKSQNWQRWWNQFQEFSVPSNNSK